jgi:hypothetical protein
LPPQDLPPAGTLKAKKAGILQAEFSFSLLQDLPK